MESAAGEDERGQAQNEALINLEAMRHKNEMEQIKEKGKWANEGERIKGQSIVEAARLGADAKLQANMDRQENEPTKQEIRTQAKIKEEMAKKNLEAQQPV